MQSGCNRQHTISKHVHRSKINQMLADEGDQPEPAWYDDSEYEVQLTEAYNEWERYQDELEMMNDAEDDWYYDEAEAEFFRDYLYEDRPVSPPNLTRTGGEWQF